MKTTYPPSFLTTSSECVLCYVLIERLLAAETTYCTFKVGNGRTRSISSETKQSDGMPVEVEERVVCRLETADCTLSVSPDPTPSVWMLFNTNSLMLMYFERMGLMPRDSCAILPTIRAVSWPGFKLMPRRALIAFCQRRDYCSACLSLCRIHSQCNCTLAHQARVIG